MKHNNIFLALSAAFCILLAAACNKTVTVPVSGVTLSPSSLTLTEGEEATLTVTVRPDNADDRSVSWSSDNTAVATVKDGKVTAVAEGTANITVTTTDGAKTATCAVTVNRKVISVTSVSLDRTTLELTEGEEATLTATVKPDDADDRSVSWSSDDTAVATVKDGKVTAVAEGTANITVTTTDGAKTATCTVTVQPTPGLKYRKMEAERLPDMLTSRSDFILIRSGNEIVAAGGHTDGFNPSAAAEYYADGQWHSLPDMKAPHDIPFSVTLPDGKILIGGGCSLDGGSGQTGNVDVYNPADRSFSVFKNMTTKRTMPHAVAVGDEVLVSGNWYGSDGLEAYSPASGTFATVKSVSQGRSSPYLFRTAADNAIVFGRNDNYGSPLSSCIIDRYKGESFTDKLFEEWVPVSLGSNFRAEDCAIGEGSDYTYLFLVQKRGTGTGGRPALLSGESFTLLDTGYDLPAECEFGKIYYSGSVVVDKSKKVGYAFGTNNDINKMVCFILKIDYSAGLAEGKVATTMYYSDPVDFSGGAQGIALMGDGRLMVAGGITNSNYSPYKSVYAFKPF